MITQPAEREALAVWLNRQVNNNIGTETQDPIVIGRDWWQTFPESLLFVESTANSDNATGSFSPFVFRSNDVQVCRSGKIRDAILSHNKTVSGFRLDGFQYTNNFIGFNWSKEAEYGDEKKMVERRKRQKERKWEKNSREIWLLDHTLHAQWADGMKRHWFLIGIDMFIQVNRRCASPILTSLEGNSILSWIFQVNVISI